MCFFGREKWIRTITTIRHPCRRERKFDIPILVSPHKFKNVTRSQYPSAGSLNVLCLFERFKLIIQSINQLIFPPLW